jgi:hypothetical protein
LTTYSNISFSFNKWLCNTYHVIHLLKTQTQTQTQRCFISSKLNVQNKQ